MECLICYDKLSLIIRNFERCRNCDKEICHSCIQQICPFCKNSFYKNKDNKNDCDITGFGDGGFVDALVGNKVKTIKKSNKRTEPKYCWND